MSENRSSRAPRFNSGKSYAEQRAERQAAQAAAEQKAKEAAERAAAVQRAKAERPQRPAASAQRPAGAAPRPAASAQRPTSSTPRPAGTSRPASGASRPTGTPRPRSNAPRPAGAAGPAGSATRPPRPRAQVYDEPGIDIPIYPEDVRSDGKRKKKSPLLVILAVFFAAVFLVSGGILVWQMVITPKLSDENLGDVQEMFEEAGGVISVSYGGNDLEEEYARRVAAVKKLKETVNKDISGWVRIEGTNINFPVMTSTPDDQYYLYRDYKGEDSIYGSVFTDGATPITGDNQLLHGHSMQDGRMFWSLIAFGEYTTVQKSPLIQYDTELEAGDWKIVSVFKTNTYASQGEIFTYSVGSFDTPQEKMQFYYELMKRSMVNTGVDLNENDKIVMLSTCSYEYDGFRTVVVARKVREGEDRSVNVSLIKEETHALFPNIWYSSGSAPAYWPEKFEDAVAAGLVDWYSGDLY